jgi:hypothetical protein
MCQEYPAPLIPSYIVQSCWLLPAAVLPIVVIFMHISLRAAASYCCMFLQMTLNSSCDFPRPSKYHSLSSFVLYVLCNEISKCSVNEKEKHLPRNCYQHVPNCYQHVPDCYQHVPDLQNKEMFFTMHLHTQ